MHFLKGYLQRDGKDKGAIATLALLDHLSEQAPEVAKAILAELEGQRQALKLIASENYSSLAVQHAMGNWLTDKYSEGIIGRRFYAGCENVDTVEALAVEEAKKIFGAAHAYVQPHSGADANLVAFLAILVKRVQDEEIFKLGRKTVHELTPEEHEKIRQKVINQKMVGLALDAGGHLTHGYRLNISSKLFQAFTYSVDPKTERIDMTALERQMHELRPAILIAGYSAYPRLIDFSKMKEIADSVGATLLVDMAHFAGLVAGKAMTDVFDPIPYADVVTTTTHKTLRGPRGGMILCTDAYRDVVDKGCPLVLGGPLPHVMAAKGVAFREVNTPDFRRYAAQVIRNSQALAETFLRRGVKLFTGGTDNHLVVADVWESFGLNGREAEAMLKEASVLINRNMVPFDKKGAWYTSGIRLGTPALTTLGMSVHEMEVVGNLIVDLLKKEKSAAEGRGVVKELLKNFPLYPELDFGTQGKKNNKEMRCLS